MTMISFRVDSALADEARAWADALGVDRSEFLREALTRQIQRLRVEREAGQLAGAPPDESLAPFAAVASWGPAEDWSNWADAQG